MVGIYCDIEGCSAKATDTANYPHPMNYLHLGGWVARSENKVSLAGVCGRQPDTNGPVGESSLLLELVQGRILPLCWPTHWTLELLIRILRFISSLPNPDLISPTNWAIGQAVQTVGGVELVKQLLQQCRVLMTCIPYIVQTCDQRKQL